MFINNCFENTNNGDYMKILITGARSGIGYETALALLKKGHFVYLSVESGEHLRALKRKEELKVENAKLLKLDITNEDDRNKVKNLDIDVLVNNAAIGIGGSLVEASMDKIRKNFEVNFFGTIALSQLFLKKMIKNDKGRIVMISSMISEITFPWLGIYASTKAALNTITTALGKELKSVNSNVKIVIVEPGLYKTGFNEVMLDNKYDDENSVFKDHRKKIYNSEKLKINAFSSHNLKSIVNKIVKAIEDPNPHFKYRAPFIQKIIQKGYIIINK